MKCSVREHKYIVFSGALSFDIVCPFETEPTLLFERQHKHLLVYVYS